MKKGLFLLPLLGGFLLAGCQITIGNKTFKFFEKDEKKEPGGDEPAGGGGEYVIDFGAHEVEVDSYVSLDSDMTFSHNGIDFAGVGCYDTDSYFMMRNAKDGSYSTKFAYFCNTTPFDKPVKEAIVTLNTGTGVSTNTVMRVNILTSAATAAVESGGGQGSASQTAVVEINTTSTDKNAYYVAVSTNISSSGKRYNGQITKLVVKF